MYCPRCAHQIRESEPFCDHCGCEFRIKRSRVKGRTIVILVASVALLTVLILLALSILDLIENPVQPSPPSEPSIEYPEAPTGPPEFPVGPEVIQPEAAPARVRAVGGLRMREGPGTEYDVVLLIPNHEHITILEEEGGWALVEYNNTSGWVSAEFLLREGDPRFLDEPPEYVVTSGTRNPNPTSARINAASGLRMRMGPGTQYHVVMVIPNDELVLAHDESDGWIYIEHLGHWGWVDATFLLDEPA